MAKTTAKAPAAQPGAALRETFTKSLRAFGDAGQHATRNLEAVTASITAAMDGSRSLGAEAFAFAKKAADDNVAAARSLAAAKSPQQAVELQTRYAKSALEAYMAGLSRWSESVSNTYRQALAPIGERATAVTEHFRSQR